MQGTGRENVPATDFPWWDDSYRSEDHSTTTAYTQNYEYDKVGNIQELQHVAGVNSFTRQFNYASGNNKLNSIGVGANTYTYSYDNCGNQILENTTRHFEYDYANNMRCFFNQAGTSEPTIYALYLYSGGQRVKKLVRTSGGGYESTVYIGGAYEYKTDDANEQNTLYVMDDSSRIAMVRTGDDMGDSTPAIKYNLEDVQGTSMALLDDTGDFVNREEYYPFGETSFGSYALKRYRFQGKEKDSESGLYYYGARYYCATSCRFISVDSVLQPGESSYVGLGNNPVNKIDPDGNVATDGKNLEGAKSTAGRKAGKDMSEYKTSGYEFTLYGDQTSNLQGRNSFPLPGVMTWWPNQQPVWSMHGENGNSAHREILESGAAFANFFITSPQHINHALQQGILNREEKDQSVWSLNGWERQGSPELQQTTNAAQTEFAIFVITTGITEGLGMAFSPAARGTAMAGKKYVAPNASLRLTGTRPAGPTYSLPGTMTESIMTPELGLNVFENTSSELLSNQEVRLWYNDQLKSLNTSVEFTEENAIILHSQRNILKAQARSMMADREAAALLDQTDPIRSFEYYVEKYSSQGYSGEKLWEKIITGSAKPNKGVNTKFGIK